MAHRKKPKLKARDAQHGKIGELTQKSVESSRLAETTDDVPKEERNYEGRKRNRSEKGKRAKRQRRKEEKEEEQEQEEDRKKKESSAFSRIDSPIVPPEQKHEPQTVLDQRKKGKESKTKEHRKKTVKKRRESEASEVPVVAVYPVLEDTKSALSDREALQTPPRIIAEPRPMPRPQKSIKHIPTVHRSKPTPTVHLPNHTPAVHHPKQTTVAHNLKQTTLIHESECTSVVHQPKTSSDDLAITLMRPASPQLQMLLTPSSPPHIKSAVEMKMALLSYTKRLQLQISAFEAHLKRTRDALPLISLDGLSINERGFKRRMEALEEIVHLATKHSTEILVLEHYLEDIAGEEERVVLESEVDNVKGDFEDLSTKYRNILLKLLEKAWPDTVRKLLKKAKTENVKENKLM